MFVDTNQLLLIRTNGENNDHQVQSVQIRSFENAIDVLPYIRRTAVSIHIVTLDENSIYDVTEDLAEVYLASIKPDPSDMTIPTWVVKSMAFFEISAPEGLEDE